MNALEQAVAALNVIPTLPELDTEGAVVVGDDEVEQPCEECGCYPDEPASGDDGDGVWFQAWTCGCSCHQYDPWD